MSKNLHEKPFDETTIAKLEIFEDYTQAWLPTFIMSNEPVIYMFDFFAGTGYDKNGISGSPIRILKKVCEQTHRILEKKVSVRVFFNEFDKKKFEQLRVSCQDFIADHPELGSALQLHLSNEDFDFCFNRLFPTIQNYPSLVLLDQNGIQFLAEKYFHALEKTVRTDFLYFVSSSYFWRFGDKEAFKTYVNLDMEEAKRHPYRFIHRTLINHLRGKRSADSNLKLYPFSLKKGANIHGIIFGASHPRAVDKFLTIAWKRNETNGEANFDIDEDKKKNQLDLFDGKNLTKIEVFQKRLRENVLNGSILDNVAAFEFALQEAHIGAHAAEELKKMKREGLIIYEGNSPLVTYQNTHILLRKIQYKILQK